MPIRKKKQFNRPLSNLDAAGNAIFATQLEQIRTRNLELRFPNFVARQLVPVNNDFDPGLQTHTWAMYSPVGMAKIISNYADDLPRADVQAEKRTAEIYSIGGSYGYNINEIAAARLSGRPLPAQRASAARRANEERVEALTATGDTRLGILGLLNQPNALVYTPPAGASTYTDFARKTAAEILVDMNGIINAIVNTTKGVERPNTLLLPQVQRTKIQTTVFQEGSDITIEEFFLKANPGITIITWERLKQAGAGSADMMVAYTRDPEYLELVIPEEWTELDPQERNLEVLIPCHSRYGGVTLFYPLSMAYATGI